MCMLLIIVKGSETSKYETSRRQNKQLFQTNQIVLPVITANEQKQFIDRSV